MKEKYRKFWTKLFPLRVGDKVRFIQITSSEASKVRREMLNKIGRVREELGENYKKRLIKMDFYPKDILEEKCYKVIFPQYPGIHFSFRGIELEKVKEVEV